MLKRFVLCLVSLCALLVVAAPLTAQSLPSSLSKDAVISVLTMGEGHEIYLSFGHASFRVRDPAQGYDEVFNYGVFRLTDPDFIPKFVYGELRYSLEHYSYQAYIDFDREIENRRWTEQVLDLSTDDRNALYRFLVDNARPENKYYLYDIILDNCATRITDALAHVFGDRFVMENSDSFAPHKSFRKMMDEYVYDRPLYQFSFYLILGMAADKTVSATDQVWLPDYLRKSLNAATLSTGGVVKPVVLSQRDIATPSDPASSDYGEAYLNPAFVLWPVLVLVIFFWIRNLVRLRRGGTPLSIPERANPFGARILDFLLFFFLGLLGFVVYYLNFFSIHTVVKENLNIMWILPTHLLAAFLFLSKKRRKWAGWYFALATVATMVPLLAWPFWPQHMILSMIPLMLIIALRAAWYFVQAQRIGFR